jgi:hypothetical protein
MANLITLVDVYGPIGSFELPTPRPMSLNEVKTWAIAAYGPIEAGMALNDTQKTLYEAAWVHQLPETRGGSGRTTVYVRRNTA